MKKSISLFGVLLLFAFKISAQEVVKKWSGGADFSVSNCLSAATFMGEKEKREPSLYSSFYVLPYFQTAPLFLDKKLKLNAELGLNVEWLDQNTPNPASPSRTPKITDLALRARINKLVNFSEVGISFTPVLELQVPTSTSSQNANRVIALGTNIISSWSKWGLTFTFRPSIMGYLHSTNYKSSLCNGSKDAKVMPDGRCLIDEQQTLAMLKNGLILSYDISNHNITAEVRTYHGFLRNTPKPSFSTLGYIEYAYTLPIETTMSLAAGVSSYQSGFNDQGQLKFPFFDFNKPSNSEFYMRVDVTI